MEKNISEVVLQGYNTTLTMVDNRNNSDINELSSPSLDNSTAIKMLHRILIALMSKTRSLFSII